MMEEPAPANHFPATRWTLVHLLRSGDEAVARRALDEICSLYHYPLYCFIRRRGLPHHDAQDALHDFFSKLIRTDALAKADSAKGRLRSFLATALHNFLLNRHRDQPGDSREPGPGCGWPQAEERYRHEQFHHDETPERIFDRKWGCELLARAVRTLGARYSEKKRTPLFEALRPVLLAGGSLRGEDAPGIAVGLGLSEGALRVALNRLLADFRTVLRAEVLQTVASPADVDEELRQLLRIFDGD
jgi:RNA polymerase sigma-70 factor (ECF subfamily)